MVKVGKNLPQVFKAMLFLTMSLSLSACGQAFFYKEGASMESAERTTSRCEAEALEMAPVAMATTWKEVCGWKNVCDTRGECEYQNQCEWVSKREDANKDLRERLVDACMEDRGYSSIMLPACPENVRKAAVPRPTTVMPRLTKDACYIRHEDGTIQIVNPIYLPG